MSEVRFGAFRTTRTIGSGALATIYAAVQEPLGRVVALKALKSEIASTSPLGQQLDREAQILADLVHPNVVLLLDASRTTSGRPYVVLEYVDGPSLEELLAKAKKRRLALSAALAIGTAVCAALEHVHERGVVHRDVKPGNILTARSGAVKLIDFGIAERPRVAAGDAPEGITPSGRTAPEPVKDAFGTPAYMSPEQVLGDFVDGRSDLFSLGVVLYEMISGARPWKAADRTRRAEPVPPLRQLAPHCPRAVERIVMRLLEKSPNERYASASIVRERLEHALRAETREPPSTLVIAGLAEAGFLPRPARTASKAAPAGSSPRRMLSGFAAIGAAFVISTLAIARPSPAQSVAGGPLELAPTGAGGLRVIATPWAHVRVDGQLLETTPFARAIPLAPGRHWVTLTHPEAAPIEREVDIKPGETTRLEATLELGMDGGAR